MQAQRVSVGLRAFRAHPTTPAEAAVERAFVRRRARAVQRTSDLLGGFAVDDLADATDGTSMAVLDLDPVGLGRLVDEEPWETYLSTQDGSHPRLALVPPTAIGPRRAPPHVVVPPATEAELATPLPGPIAEELSDGATMVLNRLDQLSVGPLRDLVEDLDAVFGALTTCNCYISRGSARGFGQHWDDHDVFIIQLRGRKLWEVFEPTHLSSHRHYVPDDAVGRASWSGVLEPGRALFIPRGWAHRVVSLDELSIHHTIGVTRPTFSTVLEMWRPPDDATSSAALATSLEADLADGPSAVQRALAAYRGEVPARSRCRLDAVERWRNRPVPAELELLTSQGGPSFFSVEEGVGLRWSGMDVLIDDDEAQLIGSWPEVDLHDTDSATRLGRQLLVHGLARPVAS